MPPGLRARRSLLLMGLVMVVAGRLPAAEPALSPAETARAQAEIRRIDARFVDEVAGIVGVSPGRVRVAMPDERRITVTAARLIDALEKDLGEPLSAEQKSAIREAGERRKAARAAALEAAGAR